MKKFGLFLISFFLTVLILAPAFGQIAKIVDVKGDVTVRKDANVSWQKAKPDMYLANEAEIRTGTSSECTLTFDEELDNMMTIKGDSHIKMEDVGGGKIYLPKGRVFSLIEDLAKLKDFQVRTPTAIAGVKGTGEEVIVNGTTTVNCFEGKAYAQGLDKSGKKGSKKDITKGFGIIVFVGGGLGDIFDLDRGSWADWFDFRDFIRGIRWPGTNRERRDRVNKILGEGKEDHKEKDFEKEFRYNSHIKNGEYYTIESPGY